MSLRRFVLVLLLLLAGACTRLPFGQATPPKDTQSLPAALSTALPTPAPTALGDGDASGSTVLHVWIPPQFDPSAGRPDSQLLRDRLDEFTQSRPGVQIDVRIKALGGPGGMIDMLSAASAAAPSILPDLIALPHQELEAAALKGLIKPLEGLSTSLDSSDWYDYARQLARLQKSTFGFPFAGDAMLLIYRPSVLGDPPRDLESALKSKGPLIFPASDPQALYPLDLYLASGGATQDGQGRPWLDAEVLAQELIFYQKAEAVGLFPSWLAQYDSDDQSWKAFYDNKAAMAVTWASRYLNPNITLPADTAAAPLPTLNGTPFTLADGWVWALGSNKPERQVLAVQLAEFLTESDFLARWTAAAGYLPPRSSALSVWTQGALQSLASQLVLSAHIYPSSDVLSSLAPALRQSTIQVLNRQGDPFQLARDAADRLNNP